MASAKVNPYALEEARYLVNQMLGDQNQLRQAIISSGARLCILGWNEYTTDLPEWSWLAHLERDDIDEVSAKNYTTVGPAAWEDLIDPFCSCGEENLLGYKGDPYSTENILVHEFAHCVHLRGMSIWIPLLMTVSKGPTNTRCTKGCGPANMPPSITTSISPKAFRAGSIPTAKTIMTTTMWTPARN